MRILGFIMLVIGATAFLITLIYLAYLVHWIVAVILSSLILIGIGNTILET